MLKNSGNGNLEKKNSYFSGNGSFKKASHILGNGKILIF